MLRDIHKGEDAQIAAIAQIVTQTRPDVLLLTDFDYDLDGLALAAFTEMLSDAGLPYANSFALRPNTGMATGVDLDSDGWRGDARDAMAYGRFAGDGGMAILSRFPIDAAGARDLSQILWRDVPGAVMPVVENAAEIAEIQRLSHGGHWIVPIMLPDATPLSLLVFSASPPVFDGPEDRNGLRNRDELLLWTHVLDGVYGPPPDGFVIAGNANLDPVDGDGYAAVMADFLRDPRLQDPAPRSAGARLAADADHGGDPGFDTADWPDGKPGNLRVSYILPARDWQVTDTGVFWPAPDDPLAGLLGSDGLSAGAHRLVWVDITR